MSRSPEAVRARSTKASLLAGSTLSDPALDTQPPRAPEKTALRWKPFKEALIEGWSAQDHETLVRMAADGQSAAQIAQVLNRSRSAVLGRAFRKRITIGAEGGRPGSQAWTLEQEADLLVMHKNGATIQDVATASGRPYVAIWRKAKKMGIVFALRARSQPNGGRPWAPEDVRKLKDACANGQTLLETAKALGRPYQSVWTRSQSMGLNFRVGALGRPRRLERSSPQTAPQTANPQPQEDLPMNNPNWASSAAVHAQQQGPKQEAPERYRRLSRLEERAIGDLLMANMELVPETDNEWRFLNGYSDDRILKEVFKDHPNPPRLESIEALRRELRGKLHKPPSPKKGSGVPPFYEALERRVAELEEIVRKLRGLPEGWDQPL
jgi:hypothetical protein